MNLKQIEHQILLNDIELSKRSFSYFLKTFVRTQDEHDRTQAIKPIPDKQYIFDLADIFQHNERVLVEKSRQMMVSWVACAFALWYVLFFDGVRIFIQSKKEKDANALLDRVKLIYRYLPEDFRKLYKTDEPMAYAKMGFSKRNSSITAVPQGADVLRQYTASLIISDEMAFQEKAEEAYMSARPTLIGGGRFIGISSPNFQEFFYLMAQDKLG